MTDPLTLSPEQLAKQKRAEYARKWRRIHKDRAAESAKQYRLANQESATARAKKWRDSDREHICKIAKKYRDTNRGYCAKYSRLYKNLKNQAIPNWFETDAVDLLYQKCAELNVTHNLVGRQKLEVDHIIPINSETVCGLHCLANLQLLSKSDNSSKGNKYSHDW